MTEENPKVKVVALDDGQIVINGRYLYKERGDQFTYEGPYRKDPDPKYSKRLILPLWVVTLDGSKPFIMKPEPEEPEPPKEPESTKAKTKRQNSKEADKIFN